MPGESVRRSAASQAMKCPRSLLISVIFEAGTLIRCGGFGGRVGEPAPEVLPRLDHRDVDGLRRQDACEVEGGRGAAEAAAEDGDDRAPPGLLHLHDWLACTSGARGRWSPATVSPKGPMLTALDRPGSGWSSGSSGSTSSPKL